MAILTSQELIDEIPALAGHPATQRWLESANEAVLAELGRSILVASTVADYLIDGNGCSTLWLPEWPLSGSITVKIDGVTQTASSYVVRGGSLVATPETRGKIIRKSGVWPVGVGNIAVSGTIGYTVIPYSLRQAVAVVVKRLAMLGGINVNSVEAQEPHIKREKFRNEETEFFESPNLTAMTHLANSQERIPAEAMALITPFKAFDF